jgi:hypothetical protein
VAKAAVGLPFPYYLELLVRFHALIYSYAIELISFIVGSIDLASLIFNNFVNWVLSKIPPYV